MAVRTRIRSSMFAAIGLLLAQAAQADPVRHRVDINPQPIAAALKDLAAQTGLQVLVLSQDASAKRSPAVQGSLTNEEALDKLLQDSGLVYQKIDDNTVAIRSASAPNPLSYAPAASDGANRSDTLRLAQADSTAGSAQETTAAVATRDETGGLDEVIVTAQKIEQNIIDVPISMTVLNRDELDAMRVQGVEDYAVSIPNVTYLKGDRGGGPSLSIRGVSGDTGGAFSPINVTVDEIPYNAISPSQLLSMRSFDAEQIDVLRGPQGTLTGANALGGIVNLVTAKPNLDSFSAKTILDVSRYDTYLLQGALNTPLSDRFGLRTTAYVENGDGATKNVGPAGGSSSTDNYGVRVAARWLATDALSFNVSFGHEEQRYGINDVAYIDQFDDGTTATSGRRAEVVGFYESFAGGVFKNPDAPWWGEGGDNNGSRVSLDFPERDRFTYDIAAFRANYEIGSHDVALLYGYFDNEGDTSWDADRTEFSHFATTVKRRVTTHSAELRTSSDYDGRLNWVAGIAWHDATTPYEEVGYATQTVLSSEWFMGDDALDPDDIVGDPNAYNRTDYAYVAQSDLTTKAVFANVFYDFTDRLHLSVGARFTEIEARFGDLCCGDDFGSDLAGRDHDDLVAGLGPVSQPDGSSNEFNPRVTLNYDVRDNVSAYVQFGTGFRPGVGNNIRLVEENVTQAVADPEYMDNYEVGIKGLFLDNTLNLAIAAFFMDYTDLQVGREAEIPIHQGIDETIFLSYTANAGKASVKGFEAEGTWQATRGLQLRAGVGYADSTVKEFDDETYSPALNMPGVRPWNAVFSGVYETPVSERLTARFRADYRWQDEGWVALFEDEKNPGNFLPSWETLDLSATVSSDNWALQAYFENVLNENYYTQQISWSFRPTTYFIPRTYGLRLTYNFGN